MSTSIGFNKNRGYANWATYIIAIALTIVACTVAVILRLFSEHDLPFQTFAALIGVIITAIITGVLLKGQSEAERRQKEQSEIFKEKLATYNRFLDAVRKYVTEPNPATKKEVIFHAMAIRMHTKSDIISAIDKNILKLMDDAGTDSEVKTLVESLNAIALIFGEELYGESMGETTNLDNFVEVISGSQEDQSEEEKLVESAEEQKEDEAAVGNSNIQAWDAKIKELASMGWTLENGQDSFTLSTKNSPVKICVCRNKGKYIVSAEVEGDSNFSQKLKDNLKGSRRYGKWWRELPINNYGVKEGTLLTQLPTNDKARASVIKWIDKLIDTTKNYKK